MKNVSNIVVNEAKEQKRGFLGTLWGILGASLLGNLLRGIRVIQAGEGKIRAGRNY